MRKPPSGASSIAGPRGSAASATIHGRSIAARRRRPAIFRAWLSRSRRHCRRAASSDCFRNREDRGERCHHRLRLRQPSLGGEGVRTRHPEQPRSAEDHGDARPRSRVPRRSHRAARRRRLRRLPSRPRFARRHAGGDDGSGARQGAAVLRHLRRHAADGDARQGACHHRRLQLGRRRRREESRRAKRT